MNSSLLFTLLLTSLTVSGMTQTTYPDLCDRHRADQSNLWSDTLSDSLNNHRANLRKQTFQENFILLTQLLESDSASDIINDPCFHKFYRITLVHNAQVYPSTFFKYENVHIINSAIDRGVIDRKNLELALFYFNQWPGARKCLNLKPLIDYAIETWKLNEMEDKAFFNDQVEISYEDCD